jgi:putative transposase
MHTSLFENQILTDVADVESERLRRVLWVPAGRKTVCLIALGRKDALPVWQPYCELADRIGANELAVYEGDPASSRLRPDSYLSAAQREQRDRRYAILEPLVVDPERLILDQECRGKLVSTRARDTGVGRNYIYSYLRLWWQLGQLPNALAPSLHLRGAAGKERAAGSLKRGRPRYGSGVEVPIGINVDRGAAEKLKDGARFLKKGMSWPQAFEKTLTLHFSRQVIEDGLRRNKHLPAEELPSLEQFRYWAGKALRPGDVQRAILGEAGFARKNRPRVGTARNLASGPGAIYQIDATVANIYLRSRLDPSRLIGRPVLYIVVDHYSRLIVGFTVALSGPSWEVGKLALENAFTDKVRFCERYNIPIEVGLWPSRHLCGRLTGDRRAVQRSRMTVSESRFLMPARPAR